MSDAVTDAGVPIVVLAALTALPTIIASVAATIDSRITNFSDISFPATQAISGTVLISSDKAFKSITGTISATGDTTLIAAVTAARIKVYLIVLSGVAVSLLSTIKSDTTTLFSLKWLPSTNGTFNQGVSAPTYLFDTSTAQNLIYNQNSNGTTTYFIGYWDNDTDP
jgi:hypothetical protein